MKGEIYSFHMRHKGFIYYKRLQSYEVHKPLDHISLVFSACRKRTNDSDYADRAFSDGDRALGCKHFGKGIIPIIPSFGEKELDKSTLQILTKIR